jgi:Flp pilus assembly protein TadG
MKACAFLRSGKDQQRGVTAIEFAMLFPFFLLILYSIVCYAVILLDKQTLATVAAQAARAAIAAADESKISGQIDAAIAGHTWIAGRVVPCNGAGSKYTLSGGQLQVCLQATPVPLPTINLGFLSLPPARATLDKMLQGSATVLWEP